MNGTHASTHCNKARMQKSSNKKKPFSKQKKKFAIFLNTCLNPLVTVNCISTCKEIQYFRNVNILKYFTENDIIFSLKCI